MYGAEQRIATLVGILGSMIWSMLHVKKYNIMLLKRKEFKDLNYLLIFYFVSARVSLVLYHALFTTINTSQY
jgi:hypothetical protein